MGTFVEKAPPGATSSGRVRVAADYSKPKPKPKAEPQTRTSQMLGARIGLMKPWNQAAQWAENAAGPAVDFLTERAPITASAMRAAGDALGLAPDTASAKANQKRSVDAAARQGVKPGKAGQFAGELIGTLPAVAVTKNPYLLGGLTGGLLSDADNAQDLAIDVAAGGVLGKLGDVAVNKVVAPLASRYVAPLVAKGGKAALDAAPAPVKAAVEKVGRVLPAREGSGPQAQAAGIVRKVAAKKGVKTGANAAAVAADKFASNPEVIGAELLGKQGEGMLQALVRQGGSAADEAAAAMYGRAGAADDRIMQNFADLGVDPATAAGDIQGVIDQGAARSGALFQEAFDQAGDAGIWNDELAALWNTPAVRTARESVAETAGDLRQPDSGLTMGRVEAPMPGSAVHPLDAPPVGDAPAGRPIIPPGSDLPPNEGQSLLWWLARQGGGQDIGGDLAAMGANRIGAYSRMPAQDLDRLALRAQEAGFMPPGERPTINDFLNLLEENASGRTTTRMRPNPEARAAWEAREAAKVAQGQYDQRPKVPLDVLEDEAAFAREYASPFDEPTGGGAPAPAFEPAFMEAPTAPTWDAIRKRVNELIDWENPDPKVRVRQKGQRTVAADLRRALAGEEGAPGAIPGPYREGIEAGGDYIAIREANKKFANKLFGSSRAFANDWLKLKGEGAREGARAALATQILDAVNSGRLKPKAFQTRDVRKNLKLAFGDKAEAFINQLDAEARLAASGSRFIADSGSPTARIKAAQDEMAALAGEDAPGGVADTVGQVLANPTKSGLIQTFLVGPAQRMLAKLKNVGLSEATRDEMARLLLLPADEFAAFIDGPPQSEAQAAIKALFERFSAEAAPTQAAAVAAPGREKR